MQGTLRAAGPARITPKKEVGDWPAYAEKATRPPRHSGSKAGGLVAILHPGVKGKANSALAAAAVERFHDWLAIRIRRPHQVALLPGMPEVIRPFPWMALQPLFLIACKAAAIMKAQEASCHNAHAVVTPPNQAATSFSKERKVCLEIDGFSPGYLLRLDQSSHVCFGHNDCEAGLLQRHHIAHFVTVITVLLPVLLFHW